MEVKNIKQLVIDEVVSGNINPTKIANIHCLRRDYVERVIKDYNRLVSVSYPIFCVASLDVNGVFYLFSDFGEKKVETDKTNDHLTDYEKYWLKINTTINII